MRIDFESFSVNVQFPEEVRGEAMDNFLDKVYDLMEESGNYVDFRADLKEGDAEFVFPMGEDVDTMRSIKALRMALATAQEAL